MKNTVLPLLLLAIVTSAMPQKLEWKAGVNSFFENNEFIGCPVKSSQTMAGVHFTPEVGMSWDERHHIFVGADVMHEFGSNKTIDHSAPVAYYEFGGNPFRFYMGAIPRKNVLSRYPRMFFQDSIVNYRPVITGLFWEYSSKNESYINVWLDWTSRQTPLHHEAFFMGWSGRYNRGIVYAQHFGYMFHFAGVMNPAVPEGLHDNGLLLTQMGINLAPKTGFEQLEASIGWSVGLERDRSLEKGHILQGFLSEIKVEYRGLELFNTYYKGAGQQLFYGDHGGELYWGDPVFRAKEYNRTDACIHFFKTGVVNVRLQYSLHFIGGSAYHSQALYASFNLDNIPKKKKTPYTYLWDNWF